jgi:ferrous iron transport protein A
MYRRFQDLGLIEGTLVRCLMKSPLGDPKAYLIRGAVIALRKSDSDTVTVDPAADAVPLMPAEQAVPHGAV